MPNDKNKTNPCIMYNCNNKTGGQWSLDTVPNYKKTAYPQIM